MIKAEVHSDDHVFEIAFDATPWFAQANDDEIRALAACEWGGDAPADDVARHFEDTNLEIAGMLAYLRSPAIRQRRDPPGFECHVDPEQAAIWLKTNRLALHIALASRQE